MIFSALMLVGENAVVEVVSHLAGKQPHPFYVLVVIDKYVITQSRRIVVT
jgi:hypothetical protein